jgi:hypothetical protein
MEEQQQQERQRQRSQRRQRRRTNTLTASLSIRQQQVTGNNNDKNEDENENENNDDEDNITQLLSQLSSFYKQQKEEEEEENSLTFTDSEANINSNDDSKFLTDLIKLLFSKNCRPNTYFLIDGDYPRRNIMHYASRFDCKIIPELIKISIDNCEISHRKDEYDCEDKTEDKNSSFSESSSTTSLCYSPLSSQHHSIDVFKLSERVVFELCMHTDYNGNTPLHMSAIYNSFSILTVINPMCIKASLQLFNQDGLNPFLLAARHSSVNFISYLIEKSVITTTDNGNEKNVDITEMAKVITCRDQLNSKNCLHYACGRGCGQDAHDAVKFLCDSALKINNSVLNDLVTGISPLTGSVYHVASSNLTRLTTLWYLLKLYPKMAIQKALNDNQIINYCVIFDTLDFRDFTTLDCLIDSLMNLREMAPPNCATLAIFYEEVMARQNDKFVETNICERKKLISLNFVPSNQINSNEIYNKKYQFDVLLKRCCYRLFVEYEASIFNLPRIRNQWQLLEFFKFLIFLSKLNTNHRTPISHIQPTSATPSMASSRATTPTPNQQKNKRKTESSCEETGIVIK